MNCQDISRFVDTGNLSHLTAAERHEAEAHARACSRCAAVWGAHVRLAGLRIPSMPAQLADRMRTLAAAPARQRNGMGRRLTLVGALVALAAAAALLAIYYFDRPAAQVAIAGPAAAIPAPAPAQPEVTAPAVSAVANEPAQTKEPLPLLLPPDRSEGEKAMDLALQKVADLHPELVEGPDTTGFFAGAITIRANGTLVASDIRLLAPIAWTGDLAGVEKYRTAQEEYQKVRTETQASIPWGASSTDLVRSKHALLPDGRSLRADVRVRFGVIADDYTPARSTQRERVLATLRQKYSHLLLPATGDERNDLVVLLAEDGSIQREDLRHRSGPATVTPPPFSLRSDDPDLPGRVAQYMAQEIARRLSVDVDQIGDVEATTLEEGKAAMYADGTGNLRIEDNRRVLNVIYAWPRRAGGKIGRLRSIEDIPTTLRPKFDAAAAAKIIKHEFPDVFTVKAADAGMPGVFFNHKGEVIRSARLRAPNGGTPDEFTLIRQLAPGVEMGSGTTWGIEDENGMSVNVVFAWEKAPDQAAGK